MFKHKDGNWYATMGDVYDQVNHDYKEANSQGDYSRMSTECYPPGHYEVQKEWANVASLPPALQREQNESQFLNGLINNHWNYIEGILIAAEKNYPEIDEIMYHYETAFRHGWKHHKEYSDANHA